jgi:hypothetical protein
MDSFDSYQMPRSAGGSRLLSESPPPADSSSSVNNNDLSLSELSLSNRPTATRPFSLLARPQEPTTPTHVEDDAGADVEDVEYRADVNQTPTAARPTKEEKLRNDLFILRKLNSAFALYNEALAATEAGSDVRRALRTNKYYFKEC